MKLAVIGAGSTRLPLMLASAAGATLPGGLDEVALFDIRPGRVHTLLPVGLALAAECGRLPRVTVADTPEEALEGALALILTVRPGFEEARALDERCCLDRGVIGQETTGPAGMAFAARSIPVVTGYCRLAMSVNPACIPVIFTNPAGMVTQALHRQGFPTAVGICDSATGAMRAVAQREQVPQDRFDFEVFGLNHLSWTYGLVTDGRDRLGPVLADEAFLTEAFPWFEPGRLSGLGRIPNEYLFYFYRAGEALEAMRSEPETRGEGLVASNGALLRDLAPLVERGAVGEALVRYAGYLSGRNDSYMAYAKESGESGPGVPTPEEAVAVLREHVGGYAEVALDLVTALSGGRERRMALNVANGGSVDWLDGDQVVETDCMVGPEGIRPTPHPAIPDEDRALVGRVKEYEDLAIRAVLERSTALAEEALVAHPLVPSRETARALVESLPGLKTLAGDER